MIVIKPKLSFKNGKYISLKNIDKIFAIASRPCTNIKGVPLIDKLISEGQEYFERWKIVKGPDGYEFREINHGCGICGPHKTLRQLIARTCGSSQIQIIVEL